MTLEIRMAHGGQPRIINLRQGPILVRDLATHVACLLQQGPDLIDLRRPLEGIILLVLGSWILLADQNSLTEDEETIHIF